MTKPEKNSDLPDAEWSTGDNIFNRQWQKVERKLGRKIQTLDELDQALHQSIKILNYLNKRKLRNKNE